MQAGHYCQQRCAHICSLLTCPGQHWELHEVQDPFSVTESRQLRHNTDKQGAAALYAQTRAVGGVRRCSGG